MVAERDRQRPVEGIAGARGIDGVDLEGLNVPAFGRVQEIGAVLTHGDHRVPDPFGDERLGGLLRYYSRQAA